MQSLITDVTTFTQLKLRATMYRASGYPNCDPEFIPLLKRLNDIPGLVTVWCCTGHPKPEEGESDRFYVVFGVDASGLQALERIYRRMSQHLYRPIPVDGLCLSTHRQFALSLETGVLIKPFCDTEVYQQWTIAVVVNTPEHVQQALEAMAVALES